ncbi:glycosyltransferase family 4 protein [Synechococcus sp. HJ21-Hayes]|uniref:glycosyltransferase family 4 protein n=1 Tax=unclassified Synechococcus TaxID=2626047 RepID=UPI0020CBFDAF|nr:MULTISPECIES: glycosyltransferase family 4 protein [unclassified Synechococcus]MCP9830267.1 glycosyltransferase family 4 protein [Synechococcus sp. JJ3a-Johnson]MCP9853008.1 glycosyltransferase family 4 protein [Synechococcus sp. HJ21-Hayes]
MILLLSYDVRRRGGIERLSLQVQACLQQRNIAVRLLCPQRIGPWGVGRQLGRLWFLLRLAWWLPRAELVLSMHALLLRPIHWLRPLRRRGQALRCWLHGIEVWGAALHGVQGDLLGCQGLIASSHFTREQLLEQPGAWPPVAVVHPMADLIDGSAAPSPLPAELRLLTIARLDAAERYKGHRLVLAALRQLLERDALPAGLQWRVVGDGNDRSALEGACAELGLSPWVQFLGALPDAALREELRHCSLLLMPSAYAIQPNGRACGEGFGIVYLEAAQAGRASIACREGGQADLIEHGLNGWLIHPSANELAELLLELAGNPEQLARAGAIARERAQTRFSGAMFQKQLLRSL